MKLIAPIVLAVFAVTVTSLALPAPPSPSAVSWSHELAVMEEVFEDLQMFDDTGQGGATPAGLKRSQSPSFRRLAETVREIREYLDSHAGD